MVNQGTLLGRVGKIETKTTNSGTKITNFTMVTSKKFVKDGQKQEKVTWHNVTCFSKLAEIAEKYVSVGDLLYIQGEMDNQKYTANDGSEKSKFFIIAHELKLMPKSKEHKAEPKPKASSDFGAPFEDDAEIPF
jgi:single-strand DNA-binding protein